MDISFSCISRVAIIVASVLAASSLGHASEESQEFSAWVAGVRSEALSRGISERVLNQSLAELEPISRVVELDRQQPEFTQTFSRYLSRAVTEERIAKGRELMRRHAKLLSSLERNHGVPARFLIAFWGLETNYGRVKGGFPVIGALATLSFDGRREAFFRRELLDALTILEQGHIEVGSMKGSWAGAMGHTQFMPSTFLAHALDQDRDGRKDLWGSVPDALGSAAKYLSELGWQFGFRWGREVKLPADFDFDLASVSASAAENNLPLSHWADLQVKRANGSALPRADINASLVVPEGAEGAAFLVYDNYKVILDWNRSVFYAIAIGHLADRIAGAGPLIASPRTEAPLTREETIELQSHLIDLGYLSGDADGILGSQSRRAVKAFQSAKGLTADGYADRALVAEVSSISIK